jgi:hypothetical protein
VTWGRVRRPTIHSVHPTVHTSRAAVRGNSAPLYRLHQQQPKKPLFRSGATGHVTWMYARVATGPSIRRTAHIGHTAVARVAPATQIAEARARRFQLVWPCGLQPLLLLLLRDSAPAWNSNPFPLIHIPSMDIPVPDTGAHPPGSTRSKTKGPLSPTRC